MQNFPRRFHRGEKYNVRRWQVSVSYIGERRSYLRQSLARRHEMATREALRASEVVPQLL